MTPAERRLHDPEFRARVETAYQALRPLKAVDFFLAHDVAIEVCAALFPEDEELERRRLEHDRLRGWIRDYGTPCDVGPVIK